MPLTPPARPWEGLTMDFVSDLPQSMALEYTGIMWIVDRLGEMVVYLPCRKDIDSPELAWMFFEHVLSKCSVPDNITTDCGKEFTSQFWTEFVPSSLSITDSQWLSTWRSMVKLSGRTRQCNSTSELCATTSRTTRSNCYCWQNWCTTTPSKIPCWWHTSGRNTITVLQCNSSLPWTPVSDHRYKQTRAWQVWDRLTAFSGKT